MTKTLPTVTELEAKLIENLCRNTYNESNGAVPESFNEVSGGVWTWTLRGDGDAPNNIKPSSLGGIVASLVEKGLAWSQEDSRPKHRRGRGEPSDAAVGITELGFAVYQSLFPVAKPVVVEEPKPVVVEEPVAKSRNQAYREAQVAKHEAIKAALVAGIERGASLYSKTADRATAIEVALAEAGFKIVKA